MQEQVATIGREAGAKAVAVAYFDYETRSEWELDGDRWFHAASTIKVPVLLGVFGAVHREEIALQSRVHVRNRFTSKVGGGPYRIDGDRDANSKVYQHLGQTMKVNELAFHMIVTSSNLATNLLVDLVGVEAIRRSLEELEVTGVDLVRGVEDEAAFREGINNRVTARGMISVLRPIEEGTAYSVELSARMLEILHQQEFRSGIPAGVPDGARVANKTGEISTVAHDAAIVYLPERRKPYVVVVLTEWESGGTGRSDTIARISRAVYRHLTGNGR
ncbi:MAG TPA: serine hydrolase [Longimicrobiaceae bacterium]|nr:serine hydrolase [Longimicrobiaceae bacterium]